MNNTREDAIAWVQSLKPGDKVIHMIGHFRGYEPVAILTVRKVTPSGIVRTEREFSFWQFKYAAAFNVGGRGETPGKIVPYTDELAEQAHAYMQKVEKEKRERAVISEAKKVCYELTYSKRPMTLELAKAILELAKSGERDG